MDGMAWSWIVQIATFLGTVLLISKWVYKRWTCNLPPGPSPLPIIGNLHQLTDAHRVHKTFTEMSKRYGDIFTIFMGSSPWIILNSQEVLKETFVRNGLIYSGRPRNGIMRFSQGLGIGFSEGKIWKDQRTFAITHLREFGFGKSSFEDEIKQEITHFVSALEQHDRKTINIRPLLENTIANVMCKILFGRRYSYDDTKFQNVCERFSTALATIVVVDLFPFVRYLPGDICNVKKIGADMEYYTNFVRDQIKCHRETLTPGHIRDFTDAYLLQMEEDKRNKTDSVFSETQCVGVLKDLFAGGLETTTSTLLSGLVHLIMNPDIQDKIRQEIDTVVGCDRTPSIGDLKNMPYVEATMHEMLRLGNPLPLGVPHRVVKDIRLKDYTLPAGATVIANLDALSCDGSVFKDPHTFDPNHFLDNGKFAKPETFIPFGVGRRMCVGDVVAKMELFLVLTSLLQRFSFHLPKDRPAPSTEGKLGFTCCPMPYELCVMSRNNNK